MKTLGNTTFCSECRKDTSFSYKKQSIRRTIRNEEYEFFITVAICDECNEEIGLPELIDVNAKEIDEQYRKKEDIVSIRDIEKLMELYDIGKNPLSLALGFGEITIPRYLEGQIPSKEYSDIIRNAIKSPEYMREKLLENKQKLKEVAYKKADREAEKLEKLFSVSHKMLATINSIFKNLGEITPLALQKLLYFTQGIHYTLYNKPMFDEDCEAWVHGPVYRDVYYIFKDFKYNTIDDSKFLIIDYIEEKLTEEENQTINNVINTFGIYSGKILEKITHEEYPWKNARAGCTDDMCSNEIITKESILQYYKSINEKYDLSKESGINSYINSMIKN